MVATYRVEGPENEGMAASKKPAKSETVPPEASVEVPAAPPSPMPDVVRTVVSRIAADRDEFLRQSCLMALARKGTGHSLVAQEVATDALAALGAYYLATDQVDAYKQIMEERQSLSKRLSDWDSAEYKRRARRGR